MNFPNFSELVESSAPEWAPPSSKRSQELKEPSLPQDFYESWQGISW